MLIIKIIFLRLNCALITRNMGSVSMAGLVGLLMESKI